MTLVQPDSTLTAIRLKVRRLTASPSEQSLTTDTIDQAINTFYQNDFPYGIKLDQMRSVYTFFTTPFIDKYPLNVNFNQGIRAPVYFEGVQGYYYKQRNEFFNMWPRLPTLNTNTIPTATPQVIDYTIAAAPFLRNEVTISFPYGSLYAHIKDDGKGSLFLQAANERVTVPSVATNNPNLFPGMDNENLSNQLSYNSVNYQLYPGDNIGYYCGTVNYITGAIHLDLTLVNINPTAGDPITTFVSQYQVGRPYCLLFWNNEFTIRPVPNNVYKVEVESYLTPVQFLETGDYPILNQWWQYIAFGSAMEILRERNDFDGVEGLREGFMRQEALVLERQGVEEIGQRNSTIFSGSTPNQGWNQGWFWPY